MGTLTNGVVSTTYKSIVFTDKTSSGVGDIYYTNASDVDTRLTTFTSALTLTAIPTFTAGIKLGSAGIIQDSGGNEAIHVTTTGSAVNYLKVIPSATTNAVTLDVAGGDTNIGLTLDAKGSGVVTVTPDLVVTGDLTVTGNDIKSSATTAITLSSDDVTVVGDLTVTGTSTGTMTLGATADGTDRSLKFGHTTNPVIMGIDDDQDMFAIHTGASFVASNDIEMDASGNVTINNGSLQLATIDSATGNNAITIASNGAMTIPQQVNLNANLHFNAALDITFADADTFELKDDGGSSYLSCVSDVATFGQACIFSGTVGVTGISKFTGNSGPSAGTGADGMGVYKTWVEHFGTVIKTNIYIDITGLRANGDQKVIGEDGGTANCHIGQVTVALNGYIRSGRITCLEQPTGGDRDIDLVFDDASDGAEAADLTGETDLVDRAGDWAINDVRAFTNAAHPTITANNYLYLRTGTNASDAAYTAGKFLIEMWGTTT